MHAAIREAVGDALGDSVRAVSPLAGGDINEAFAVTLGSGREVFVKTNPRAAARMFWCEARGLAWLAQAGAIALPRVVAVSAPDGQGPHFLALEMLHPGPRQRDFDKSLGRGLAALHRAGADCFGLDHDNFLATLAQDNTPCATWSDFYATRRLLPLVRLAVDHHRAPPQWIQRFARLAARLEQLVGPAEPPARLHGDLWGGNVHADASGAPVLIDPAVYGGHREIDLAMLALFGGASEALYTAYNESFPLAPEWHQRIPLYQLYPLLAHVNLFGGSYVGAVQHALARYE